MQNFETIIITTVAVAIQTVLASYYVNRTDIPWDYQNPPCKLATPEIVYSSDGPTIRLLDDIKVASDEKLLVGYTKIFEVMEYIGCIWKGALPDGVRKYSTRPDPGECYSACHTEYFGIEVGHCHCFSKASGEVHGIYPYCDRDCSYPPNTACGGSKWGYRYISMYKRVAVNSKGPDDGKNCRIYDQRSDSFSWQNCDKELKGFCIESSTSKLYYTLKSNHWNLYTRDCFHDDFHPATDKSSRMVIDGEPELWIGRIKSWVILAVDDATQENTSYGYYGYITKGNDKFLLQFTEKQPGHVLCMKDTKTTDVAIVTELEVETTSSVVNTTFSTSMKSTETSAKASEVTATDAGEQGHTEEQRSSVSIVVYVTIPLVLLAGAAIVVCVIIRRKRKQRLAKVVEKVKYTKHGTPLKPSNTAVTNISYIDDFVSTAPRNQNHDQILPDLEYENAEFHRPPLDEKEKQFYSTTNSLNDDEINVPSECRLNRGNYGNETHAYKVLENSSKNAAIDKSAPETAEDNEYDSTRLGQRFESGLNGNIYNKLNDLSEDIYDHTDMGDKNLINSAKLSIGDQVADNAYDCFNRDGDTDVYNRVGGDISQQMQTEDTYNHIT